MFFPNFVIIWRRKSDTRYLKNETFKMMKYVMIKNDEEYILLSNLSVSHHTIIISYLSHITSHHHHPIYLYHITSSSSNYLSHITSSSSNICLTSPHPMSVSHHIIIISYLSHITSSSSNISVSHHIIPMLCVPEDLM